MKCSVLPLSVGLLKLMLSLFLAFDIQGGELNYGGFVKNAFNICLDFDTCD